MNATLEMERPAEAVNMIALVENEPACVLLEPKKFEALLMQMRAESSALVIDLTTEKGRKEIASAAYKVSRTKTAIEHAAKGLTEGWRKQTQAVNAQRNQIVDTLDALRDEVRKPLTDWEDAEKSRIERCAEIKTALRSAGIIAIDESAASVRARVEDVSDIEISGDQFRSEYDETLQLKAHVLATLRIAIARIEKEEADRAELERLRAAEAERQRIEQERLEAEAAEARRKAEEEAQAARIAAAEKRAAEEAMAAAECKAREEREASDRAHAEALAAERHKAEEAERQRIAAEQKIAAEKVAAEAEAKRIADEDARRAADRKHRGEVMGATKAAMMTVAGIDEEAAKKIVLAIVAGEIPHVSLSF